MQTNAAV